MSRTFDHLLKLRKELSYYERACELFNWDMYTKTPLTGYEDMGEALTYFSSQAFERSTSQELYETLKALSEPEESRALSPLWRESVSYLLRELEKNKRIPQAFYTSYVQAQNASAFAWRRAKEEGDYSLFASHLDTMIDDSSPKTAPCFALPQFFAKYPISHVAFATLRLDILASNETSKS